MVIKETIKLLKSIVADEVFATALVDDSGNLVAMVYGKTEEESRKLALWLGRIE